MPRELTDILTQNASKDKKITLSDLSDEAQYMLAQEQISGMHEKGIAAITSDDSKGLLSRGISFIMGNYSVKERTEYVLGVKPEGLLSKIGYYLKHNPLTDSWGKLRTTEMNEIQEVYKTLKTDKEKTEFKGMLAGYIKTADDVYSVMRKLYGVSGKLKRGVGLAATVAVIAALTGGVGVGLAAIGALTITTAASVIGGTIEEYVTGLYARSYSTDGASKGGQTYDAAMTGLNALVNMYFTAGLTNLVNYRTESKYAVFSMHQASSAFLEAWKAKQKGEGKGGVREILSAKQMPSIDDRAALRPTG